MRWEKTKKSQRDLHERSDDSGTFQVSFLVLRKKNKGQTGLAKPSKLMVSALFDQRKQTRSVSELDFLCNHLYTILES